MRGPLEDGLVIGAKDISSILLSLFLVNQISFPDFVQVNVFATPDSFAEHVVNEVGRLENPDNWITFELAIDTLCPKDIVYVVSADW